MGWLQDRAKRSVKGEMRVVTHQPWQRALLTVGVAATCALGIYGGYWLGQAKAGLDRTYAESLESINTASIGEIGRLNDALVEAGLAREVDLQTAQELRESIKGLRGEIAALTEEVTFYKSLMAPSSLPRGLQIAEFDLLPTGERNQFSFHLLLAQVLSLTEIAEADNYPLKFRFRYFQGLSGTITLPGDFEPESVVITARRRGTNTADLTKTFARTIAEDTNREFRS